MRGANGNDVGQLLDQMPFGGDAGPAPPRSQAELAAHRPRATTTAGQLLADVLAR